MAMTTLQNLTKDQLLSSMERYPFAAIFPFMLAKKEKDSQGDKVDIYTTKASLRVPSRSIFGKFMTAELAEQNESVVTNPLQLSRNEASELAKSLKKPYALPLMYAQETDIGEIILENNTKFYPVDTEEFVYKEVVVDGNTSILDVALDPYAEAKSKRKKPNYAQPLEMANETDEGEIVLDNPTTKKLPVIEDLGVKEVIIDGKDEFVEPKIEEQPSNQKNPIVSFSGLGNNPFISQQRDFEDFNLNTPQNEGEINHLEVEDDLIDEIAEALVVDEEIKDQTIEQEDSIRKIPLPVEDDLIDKIADELVADEEIKQSDFESEDSLRKLALPVEDDLVDEIAEALVADEEIKQSTIEQENSIRNIPLPVEDDLVDEIADALIAEEDSINTTGLHDEHLQEIETPLDDHVEEISQGLTLENYSEEEIIEKIDSQDTKPVSSLSAEDEDSSIYKKIVNLLNEDIDNKNTNVSDIVLDVDFNEIGENRMEPTAEMIEEEEDENDELETLYAQAAYEAELENELAKESGHIEIEEEEIEVQQIDIIAVEEEVIVGSIEPKEEKLEVEITKPPIDQSQKNSFSGWLSQLSHMGTDFVQHQKELDKIPESSVVESEDINQEIEEKQVISTKEVQEMAKKSTILNKSFYTETLAYVYEQQEKWSRAIEVYEQLSLHNPQKSSYFANRIKLLKEKL